MNEQLIINHNLTPENAIEQGFVWHSDKIYDPAAPAEVNQGLVDWIANGGIVGQAANPIFNDHAVGLYEPVKSNIPTDQTIDSNSQNRV